MTAPGRFPLHPGKPLVFRRSNGAWGYSCICHGRNTARLAAKPSASDRHNCESWAHAIREALNHVAIWHKTQVEREVDQLEALYALPAQIERTTT